MKKLLTLATVLISAIIGFSSCASAPKGEVDIDGSWKSVDSTLVIDKANKTFAYVDSSSVYEGNEIVIEEIDDKSGTIFFKQTKAYEQVFEDPNDDSWTKVEQWVNHQTQDVKDYDPKNDSYQHWLCWYRWSSTSPDVGKWFAMSYKGLSTNSVMIRFPWKIDGANNGMKLLDFAKDEYTIENGYFPSYGKMTKVK